MLDPSLLAREYGYLDDVVFVDICSVAMPPRRVREAYGSFMDDYVRAYGRGLIESSWNIVEEARGNLSRLVNGKVQEIAFTKNTCEGISILASGFSFEPGDNVVVCDQEHPSNMLPWINARQRGVELRVVTSVGPTISVPEIIALTDSRTRIIAISAAQFSTGFLVDLALLGSECRSRGIHLAVDAIQVLGRIPIDVQRLGIDYMSAGGNKGLLGTLGSGVVYCRSDLAEMITPPYAGYQSVINSVSPPATVTNFEDVNWHSSAQRFESGNLNFNGIHAMSLGVSLILELGLPNIAQWTRALEDYVRAELIPLDLDVINLPDAHRSGTICINISTAHQESIATVLLEHGVFATVRAGTIRISLGFYNTFEQMDRLITALGAVARIPSATARQEG